MKAILLAGGKGARLAPITEIANKHLLPIYHWDGVYRGTPLIEFPIYDLKNAGIEDVAIVLGDNHCEDIFKYLKDGSQYGMNFSYYYQGEPLGIAHAVTCVKDFLLPDDDFIVYLGDNFFSEGIADFVKYCEKMKEEMVYWHYPGSYSSLSAGLLFAHTKTPERFGHPIFLNSIIQYIIEKPEKPQTDLALTGCYYFNDAELYFDAFHKLMPSKRGEYELTDLINILLSEFPNDVIYQIYDDFWSDMGTFESIKEVENYLSR